MNGSGPIMEYKGIREAAESLKEWQKCLGLEDWIIKVKLCEESEMVLKDSAGTCDAASSIKSALIQIIFPKYCRDRIRKYCAEKILVHELLHCKFSLLDTDDVVADRLLHQIIEDLSYSLIMSKYDITRDFFTSILYEEEEKV